MAKNITVVKEGGEAQTFNDLNTVADAAAKVGGESCTAAVNGEPADMDESLSDYCHVSFARKDKAGA